MKHLYWLSRRIIYFSISRIWVIQNPQKESYRTIDFRLRRTIRTKPRFSIITPTANVVTWQILYSSYIKYCKSTSKTCERGQTNEKNTAWQKASSATISCNDPNWHNIAVAAWNVTRQLNITGGVQTFGDIAVYNEADTQAITNFDFNLFTGGASNTQNFLFRIRNTGKVEALVTWEISASSNTWTVDTAPSSTKDYYRNIVGSDIKYTLKMNKQSPLSGIWAPKTATEPSGSKQIVIDPDQSVLLALEIWYNGAVNIPETFSLTASFYAENTWSSPFFSESCSHPIFNQ